MRLLLTTIILTMLAQPVWADDKIVNAEFRCMPYEGGSLRSYNHLTEQPFRLIDPTEIFVVVDGEKVRVNYLGYWETLRRDHPDASWVAASSENLSTQHMHIRINQNSDTFDWKFQLVKNGSMQMLQIGSCTKNNPPTPMKRPRGLLATTHRV